MNSTDMQVPTNVPSNRAMPFCRTIPDSGWATMIAVIRAQDGCCKPQRMASHNASPAPSTVLIANCTAARLGANSACKVIRTKRTPGRTNNDRCTGARDDARQLLAS